MCKFYKFYICAVVGVIIEYPERQFFKVQTAVDHIGNPWFKELMQNVLLCIK